MTMTFAGRSVAVFSLSLLLLASCKKSSSDDQGGDTPGGDFIQFNLDGTAVLYKSVLRARNKTSVDGTVTTYALTIDGYLDSTLAPANHLSLAAFSNTVPAAPATFQDPEKYVTLTGSKSPNASVIFMDADQKGFISLGAAVDENGTVSVPGVVADAKITVSELSGDRIKGTFSGTVYLNSDISFKTTHSITNGTFSLPVTP